MNIRTHEPLSLLSCDRCQSTGFVGYRKCPVCHGMQMGMSRRGHWLYWKYPLTRYYIALERGRRIFNHVRLITALVLWFNCWLWLGFLVYKHGLYKHALDWEQLAPQLTSGMLVLFWLGVFSFLYGWYRLLRRKEFTGSVERYQYDARQTPSEAPVDSWQQVAKLPRRKRLNIARAYTEEALAAVGNAYRYADRQGFAAVQPEHLLYVLLSFNRIANIFVRLAIPPRTIQTALEQRLTKEQAAVSTSAGSAISDEVKQVLFQAYEAAYQARQNYVSVTELLLSSVYQSPLIQEVLFDLNVNENKLKNVVEWARMRERLYRQYLQFSHAARHRSKYGMDKAMTALATPYLNQFSDDLTALAQFGYLDRCVARQKEIDEVYRIIEGGRENVLLVGDIGVGRRSVIEGIAQAMVGGNVPKRLHDKRLVRLSISALLAGTTPAGAVERLRAIMHEVARARNIILFIHNIHELIGVSAGGEGSLDMADTLEEFLKNNQFLTLATATTDAYARHIATTSLAGVFAKVDILEMDENQAIQVLESKAGGIEYKHQVFFAYDALEKAVQLSAKVLRDIVLPGSALEVITEAASLARNKKGINAFVTADEVSQVLTEKTHIPLTAITSDESEKLLRLEEAMHQRVIGQDEAVSAVANALRRARAEIRSAKRPIADFLFLGPTGVGKTELAKTIAAVYFGGEDRMIRLDMSEYQDKASIYRLIGTPGEPGSGILTEAAHRNPFSLVLLDEIEKADHDILNIFLQVMDDGRLTDSVGKVIDFTNTIIIATSNAATSYVQEQLRSGLSPEAIKDRLLHGELKEYFRPEFLNRFDGIILFQPLLREDIKAVARLLLQRLAADLAEKGITLQVADEALDFLADVGFDPEFGARPMRRAIQERVENKLAEMLLSGQVKRKDTVVVVEGGVIRVV